MNVNTRVAKIRSIIFLLTTFFLITGCSTKHITTAPSTNLLATCKTVTVDVSGNVAPEIIDQLTREVKAGLLIAGFDVVDSGCSDMTLDVDVLLFKPGNAGLRVLVGFGAGRGSLTYKAEYLSREGVVVAEMDGQERFTGGDVDFNLRYGHSTGFGGPDTVRAVLVKEAARHIVKLAFIQ